jgi:hypothetical protein
MSFTLVYDYERDRTPRFTHSHITDVPTKITTILSNISLEHCGGILDLLNVLGQGGIAVEWFQRGPHVVIVKCRTPGLGESQTQYCYTYVHNILCEKGTPNFIGSFSSETQGSYSYYRKRADFPAETGVSQPVGTETQAP